MKLASRVFKTRDLIRTQVSKARVRCFGNTLTWTNFPCGATKIEFIRLEFYPPLKHKSTAYIYTNALVMFNCHFNLVYIYIYIYIYNFEGDGMKIYVVLSKIGTEKLGSS